jgi:hypothetical protein
MMIGKLNNQYFLPIPLKHITHGVEEKVWKCKAIAPSVMIIESFHQQAVSWHLSLHIYLGLGSLPSLGKH